MTLLEQHAEQAKKRKKKDDEPQPIWDRDLHMSVGGKLMDDKDRKAQYVLSFSFFILTVSVHVASR
jgi:hypothetical protein